jgi:hypothetical protein
MGRRGGAGADTDFDGQTLTLEYLKSTFTGDILTKIYQKMSRKST